MIFSANIADLIHFANSVGVGLTFGEAYRTMYQQKQYLATGKSRTLNSNHLKRLAVDFNFFIKGKLTYNKKVLQSIGDYWESLHPKNKWGGNWRFRDTPHFEMKE
ncbi:M15 family metallopeptidase [Candidatus Venteria ishoeyi]|nr:M15 family metallopeptidase [Candidatus Venteria ishoeyi]